MWEASQQRRGPRDSLTSQLTCSALTFSFQQIFLLFRWVKSGFARIIFAFSLVNHLKSLCDTVFLNTAFILLPWIVSLHTLTAALAIIKRNRLIKAALFRICRWESLIHRETIEIGKWTLACSGIRGLKCHWTFAELRWYNDGWLLIPWHS